MENSDFPGLQKLIYVLYYVSVSSQGRPYTSYSSRDQKLKQFLLCLVFVYLVCGVIIGGGCATKTAACRVYINSYKSYKAAQKNKRRHEVIEPGDQNLHRSMCVYTYVCIYVCISVRYICVR